MSMQLFLLLLPRCRPHTMRAASPSCSVAGQPLARFSSRYRPHALLLLPLLLMGHFLVSRGVLADDVQYGSASNIHTRLLRRLSRSHFSHPPHQPPLVADFTESDGYLSYHDDAPSVTVTFPDGATLNAEIPPSTSADPSSAQDAQVPVPGSDDELLRKRDGAAGRPEQLHPITHLIREAEVKWEAMLARQSTTLKAAVLEYRRRYRREPPLGFDAW